VVFLAVDGVGDGEAEVVVLHIADHRRHLLQRLRAGDGDEIRADAPGGDDLVRDAFVRKAEVAGRLREGRIYDRIFDDHLGHGGTLRCQVHYRYVSTIRRVRGNILLPVQRSGEAVRYRCVAATVAGWWLPG